MKLHLPTIALVPLKGTGFKGVDSILEWAEETDIVEYDIRWMDRPSLDQLLKAVQTQKAAIEALEKGPSLRVILANIRVWTEALDNPGDAKPRRLQQVPGLMKNLIMEHALREDDGMPRFWLYEKGDASDEKWSPHLITGLQFHPKDSYQDSPPYVTMEGEYYKNGHTQSKMWKWDTADIRGRTLIQMLQDKDLFFESEEMHEAYKEDIALMRDIRPSLGKQFTATGSGTLESSDRYNTNKAVVLDRDGLPIRLVVDDERGNFKAPTIKTLLWEDVRFNDEGVVVMPGDTIDLDTNDELYDVRRGKHSYKNSVEGDADALYHYDVPLHANVRFFDLERHQQVWVHVRNVTEYVYRDDLDSQLVLPAEQKDLLHVLMEDERVRFEDIVRGKSGGRIILTHGPPGTGKTLTAEVYSESVKRPLLVVQSAHLGTSAKEVQDRLKWYLNHASRLGLLLLLDEADVFIHKRGQDLHQNAIVGMFLQVLEYYRGILFMTTNRKDIVDDAILSRCVASIGYDIPSQEAQVRIWMNLAAASKVEMAESAAVEVAKRHPNFSGRDVKNLLKLAVTVNSRTGKDIDAETIDWVLRFKPTADIVPEVPVPSPPRLKQVGVSTAPDGTQSPILTLADAERKASLRSLELLRTMHQRFGSAAVSASELDVLEAAIQKQ